VKSEKIEDMKRLLVLVAAALVLVSAGKKGDTVMTKENGTYVVNTTTLTNDVEGYAGPVPVKVYIKKNKVEKVEVLPNKEGPKYMNNVKNKLLEAWNGLTVKEAKAKQVDAVTGATFTSKALIENVQRGLDYYQKNK
jgi:electron transport complex protein RnfG